MPVYSLVFKAELEGVESLRPAQETTFCLAVASGSESKEGVILDPNETVEIEGSRGTANLVIKIPGMAKVSLFYCGACCYPRPDYSDTQTAGHNKLTRYGALHC